MTEQMIYHQSIKLPYRYTAGAANSAFLSGLADHRILAGRCVSCEQTVAPLAPFCSRCGAALDEQVEVGPGGYVTTWTTDSRGRTYGRIRLDGADTDLMHLIEGAVAVGARVQPMWADDVEPEITAISKFVVE